MAVAANGRHNKDTHNWRYKNTHRQKNGTQPKKNRMNRTEQHQVIRMWWEKRNARAIGPIKPHEGVHKERAISGRTQSCQSLVPESDLFWFPVTAPLPISPGQRGNKTADDATFIGVCENSRSHSLVWREPFQVFFGVCQSVRR